MIYDYANQYWDHLFNGGPAPQRVDRKVTIEQHLAWPETRLGNLLTWLRRPVEGWDNATVMGLFYEHLAAADVQDEAHF